MNFDLQPVLENDKVILYPLRKEDFEEVYAAASDPKVWEQHPNPDRWKREVFSVFFEGALQSGGAFRIADKQTGKTIGSTRLYNFNGEENSIFLGYTFYSADCWGQGINSSVKNLMLDYIFGYVSKVYFHIGARNIRSQIAIGRVGAQKIGTEKIAYFGEPDRLNYLYEIRKENYALLRNPETADVLHNIIRINERILLACEKAGRNPDDVRLLLATKTVSAERIATALLAGYTLRAENKVQEIKEKYAELSRIPHTCHFIGHLQTNKIKDILKHEVACVQSLDRMDLAEKLQQKLELEKRTIDVLVQINTSFEDSKFGVAPEDALRFIKEVSQFSNLRIRGLMTIGLLSAEPEEVRKCFRLLKNIQQEVIAARIPGVAMEELSMGMSGDLETAIEEGSTMVRVGTAIFGQRPTPDSYYWNENA